MRARTAHELQRRCQTLILFLKKDTEENKAKKQVAKPAKDGANHASSGVLENNNSSKSHKRRASVSAEDANSEAAAEVVASASKARRKRV